MKVKNNLKLFVIFFVVCVFFLVNCSSTYAASQEFSTGTYTSNDGHTITINEDSTILYDGTYSLTAKASDRGDTLTGKIGSNSKSVTFYQLNSSKLVSGAVINYTHDGETVYLYDYTVFSLDSTPVEEADSGIEVWRNGSKINSYADLQSAVDAAKSGDTIKITKDLDVVGGAYVTGKTLTIDGGEHTLNSATWANSIFIVEEDATLNVNNLTIDGGATGFEVDYDAVTFTNTTIPLKTGSATNDPKANLSAIISKGNLVTNGLEANNCYTTYGGAINVVSGNLTLTNSKFNHNRASKMGGAVYIGSNFKQNQTTYPVKNVVITECEFSSNYAVGGGAIELYNTENVSIENSDFLNNASTTTSGGAIRIDMEETSAEYYSKAEEVGLPYIQFEVTGCLFDGNWTGNDGFAIENQEAELYVTDTQFKNNVGTHPTSSVGTISDMACRENYYDTIITDCLFENNYGAASVFSDHNTLVNLTISGTKFIGNKGSMSILLYSSTALIADCEFIDEYVTQSVVNFDTYSSSEEEPVYELPVVTFDNVSFTGTVEGASDIVVRRNQPTFNLATLVLENDVNAKIDVWNDNELIINGNYTGILNTDGSTASENITIGKNGTINGEVNYNINKYKLTLVFTTLSDTRNIYRYIYTDEKTFTPQEFFREHMISEEGYILEYYTDSAYTTEWDYTVSGDITIYGKWVEHEHTYDGSLIVYKNAIYEQCECGYLGKSLSLGVPTDLVENGKEIAVVVNNELGIASSDYSIVYQVENKNGNWEDIEGTPINKGTYKAILTYKNMSIEQEYSITEKVETPPDNKVPEEPPVVEPGKVIDTPEKLPDNKVSEESSVDTTKNPDTSDNILISVIVAIISLGALALIVTRYKKEIKNK